MIKRFWTRKQLIKDIAKYVANLQGCADVYYYLWHDQDLCAYELEKVDGIKVLTAILGIHQEVWTEAKKIYDFTNSGREGYTYKDGTIVKIKEDD